MENPVLALFWPCTGLQCCKNHRETLYFSKGKIVYVVGKPCNIYRLQLQFFFKIRPPLVNYSAFQKKNYKDKIECKVLNQMDRAWQIMTDYLVYLLLFVSAAFRYDFNISQKNKRKEKKVFLLLAFYMSARLLNFKFRVRFYHFCSLQKTSNDGKSSMSKFLNCRYTGQSHFNVYLVRQVHKAQNSRGMKAVPFVSLCLCRDISLLLCQNKNRQSMCCPTGPE